MSKMIETQLLLPKQMAEEIKAIAKLAGLSPQSVIKLALATEVRRWQKGGSGSQPTESHNDRVEGRDAALSRRVPPHDGLGGTDNGGEMITGGFGTTMDLERGTSRQWVVGRDGVKRWADNGEPVEAPAEPAPIDEWAERCLGTWPQLQEHWKYMLAETKRLKRENSLLRQALTRAVALPMGQLPHGDEYFTTMLNGNVIVMPNVK